MFVADAQCMCDRSYEEDDAEDDEAEDTGYGQHRTRDLLNVLFVFLCDRGYVHTLIRAATRNTRIFPAFYTTKVDFSRKDSLPTTFPLPCATMLLQLD
ncbi:hypothetical protein WH47_11806 [Habropoda laboriosa]|uniref:Uncharacterized protein n=1 Tax=Habropoda laboriosa TaxID=597456 RepID=A0A0L7R8I3_9HYME|nr:hypothetical protein WH47_11806 [Habropoda laboriosa]